MFWWDEADVEILTVVAQFLWFLKFMKFSRDSLGNCLWCYFRLAFMSLAFKKRKKKCFAIPKIVLLLGFCPRKNKITRSSNGFTCYVTMKTYIQPNIFYNNESAIQRTRSILCIFLFSNWTVSAPVLEKERK